MTSDKPEALLQFVANLFRQGYTSEEITSQLRNIVTDDNLLQQALAEIKKLHHTKRRNNGFIWCSIGIFLLVTGCMLTIIMHNKGQNIRFVMYGLTSIGVIVLIKGLIDVFGW